MICSDLLLRLSENVQLLTSFFELLRKLKIDGRSFSVCFRSFGTDLIHMEKEYNSFCEGRHPGAHAAASTSVS